MNKLTKITCKVKKRTIIPILINVLFMFVSTIKIGKAIKIYRGIEASVPVRVGVKTASQLKISHSLLTFLFAKIKTTIAKTVDTNSKDAFKSGNPDVVVRILMYLQKT